MLDEATFNEKHEKEIAPKPVSQSLPLLVFRVKIYEIFVSRRAGGRYRPN